MSSSNRRSSSSASRSSGRAGSRPRATARSGPSSRPAGGRGASQARPLSSTRAPRPPRTDSNRRTFGGAPEAQKVGRLSVSGLGLHDHKKKQGLPWLAKVAIAIAAVLALGVAVLVGVSKMPVLTVGTVQADGTEHLTSDEIVRLAAVPDDATLLNVDVGQIQENLSKNPWVKNVTVTRVLPDTIKLSVEERTVFALVTMKTGTSVWYLSAQGVWIEPASVSTTGDQTTADAALALAAKEGCLLIQEVPSSVQPKAGTKTTDEAVLAVLSYQEGFSEGFASQVVSYTAQSTASISCSLKNGIEVSLGSPSQIASKEAVVTKLMAEHPNQLTYINVRNPSKPSYRKVNSDAVGEGTGVVAPNPDDGAASESGTDADTGTGDGAGSGTDDGAASDTGDGGTGAGGSTTE